MASHNALSGYQCPTLDRTGEPAESTCTYITQCAFALLWRGTHLHPTLSWHPLSKCGVVGSDKRDMERGRPHMVAAAVSIPQPDGQWLIPPDAQ